MQSYIETLGRMISAQVAPHPRRARRMLTAAYSWVRFSGKCQKLTDAKSAYARMNGVVARSLVRGLRHPERAVCVNIFMPCEMLHAMGLTPMFPEGLSVYVACTACQHVFAERAEVSGIPESFCSYHKTMHRRGVLRRAGGTAAGVPQTSDTGAGGDFASVGRHALQRKNMW